jgi:hypothetical protein
VSFPCSARLHQLRHGSPSTAMRRLLTEDSFLGVNFLFVRGHVINLLHDCACWVRSSEEWFLQFRAIACIRFAQSSGTQRAFPKRDFCAWFRRQLIF